MWESTETVEEEGITREWASTERIGFERAAADGGIMKPPTGPPTAPSELTGASCAEAGAEPKGAVGGGARRRRAVTRLVIIILPPPLGGGGACLARVIAAADPPSPEGFCPLLNALLADLAAAPRQRLRHIHARVTGIVSAARQGSCITGATAVHCIDPPSGEPPAQLAPGPSPPSSGQRLGIYCRCAPSRLAAAATPGRRGCRRLRPRAPEGRQPAEALHPPGADILAAHYRPAGGRVRAA